MSSVKILHNPRCSKSRQTLALIENAGYEPEITLYLKDKLGKAELKQLANYLDYSDVSAMMRTKEPEFKTMGLTASTDQESLFDAMVTCPKLIERPIVIVDNGNEIRAKIGRPPENVLEILP